MKKLVLFAAVFAAVAFSACKKTEAPVQETTPPTEEVTAPETPATETPAEEVPAEAPAETPAE